MWIYRVLIVFGILINHAILCAQDFTKPDPTYTPVTLDLINTSTKDLGLLPFDDAILFVPTYSNDSSVKLAAKSPYYIFLKNGRCYPFKNTNSYGPGRGFDIPAPNMFGPREQMYVYYGQGDVDMTPFHLEPNKKYCILVRPDPYKSNDTPVQISAHTASSFSNVVKLDIGVAYVPSVNTSFGVVSAHLYFSPINDDADIKITSPKSYEGKKNKWIWKRLSVFACVAPFTILSGASQEIKPLPNLGNFGFGIGWRSPFYGYKPLQTNDRVYQIGRIFQPIRLNLGILHYAQANANPVIPQTVSKWSFMVSFTYSFGVAALLGPLVKLFN